MVIKALTNLNHDINYSDGIYSGIESDIKSPCNNQE